MAPPNRYPSPPKQLGELVRRARGRGLSFEEFWLEAVRPEKSQRIVMVSDREPPLHCVRWPSDPKDRREWRQAVLGTKEGWRRAYEGETPTRSELAVVRLADMLDGLDDLGTDDAELAVA